MNAQPAALFAGLLFLLAVVVPGQGQIDPEQRRLIQLGYNKNIEGRGPTAGYAFYYHNQRGIWRTNLTLRVAIAPVYADTELGIAQALGPHTDVGFGLSGGGFADSFSEVRGGISCGVNRLRATAAGCRQVCITVSIRRSESR